MKHLRYLLMAALVAMPLTACDEDTDTVTPPVITGTVTGSVTAEGTALNGVTVSLSGPVSDTEVTSGGAFTFADLEAGTYTVSIDASSLPDVVFSGTSKSTTIAVQDQTQTVDFGGNYIRTSSIQGSVSANGAPVVGATVTITGGGDAVSFTRTTSLQGDYIATALRSGTYTVTVTDATVGVTVAPNFKSVQLAPGETGTAHFAGTMVELGSISGAVTIDGVGTPAVTVTLTPPVGADVTTQTGVGGGYLFPDLVPGSYTVAVTARGVEVYTPPSQVEALEAGEDATLSFAGLTPAEPATISLGRITYNPGGGDVDVVLTNVFGQIGIDLNITRGDRALDRVDVVFQNEGMDPVVVASHPFNAGAPGGPEAVAGATEVVHQLVPTNQITVNPANGRWIPVVFNGKANISAVLYEVGGTPNPTNDVPVIMNNVDVLMPEDGAMKVGTLTRRPPNVASDLVGAPGTSWNTGGLVYDGPIYIAFGTKTQTASWTAGACLAGTGSTDGAFDTGIKLTNNWTCPGVEAQNQGPGTSFPTAWTGSLLGPDGTAVTRPATWSALGAMFELDGMDRWYVLTTGPAGYTAPPPFDIDNKAPTVTMQNSMVPGVAKVAFNDNFDQAWINASYTFSGDATWSDGGVGVQTTAPDSRVINQWGTTTCNLGVVLVTGDDLLETLSWDGNPDGWRICASGMDRLGNGPGVSGVSNFFGVDKAAPLARFHAGTVADPLVGLAAPLAITPNKVIYSILAAMPYLGPPAYVWGLEGLDLRAGFNQNAVTGFPAGQTITRTTKAGITTAGPTVASSPMGTVLADDYVRTTTELAFHDALALPGYYKYTGIVTDRAGNTWGPYVRNWLTDDALKPSITYVNLSNNPYAPGMPADFVFFGSDDLEIITASFTMDYPSAITVLPATLGIQYDFPVGSRWDGLDPFDAGAFVTAVTGAPVQVDELVGRIDFTCAGLGLPYASCAAADTLPGTLSEYNLAGTDGGLLPVSVTPVAFEDAGGNLSLPAAPILINHLQFNDSTAAPWSQTGVPDIDHWKIIANTLTTFQAEHRTSTGDQDTYFDKVLLVLNDAGTLKVCNDFGAFGNPPFDNGFYRLWQYPTGRPGPTTMCGMAQAANALATYHAVGVKGDAWLVSQGIL